MHVFSLRDRLIDKYRQYAHSFIHIKDERIRRRIERGINDGDFLPEPLIQLNPHYESGGSVRQAIADGYLHPGCERIFLYDKENGGVARPLYRHQRRAIEIAKGGQHLALTTGTGSGKSLAYIAPIVDHVLRCGSGRGIQAILVYPMNALVNSQEEELNKFLVDGFAAGEQPVTFARYTGQVDKAERDRVINSPPDILLTNYVMLELIMTRPQERRMLERARGLRFIVLDELHTYRGRQGADVALLMRRARNRLETESQPIQFIGTSATLASEGSFGQQQTEVAAVATDIFGVKVAPQHVVGESLRRVTRGAFDAAALAAAAAAGAGVKAPSDYQAFRRHAMSIWIERTFGLSEDAADGRLRRQEPRAIKEAAATLSAETGADATACAEAIKKWLLDGYRFEDPETGMKPFAFRLHQFISPGDAVYATLEAEAARHISLSGQRIARASPQAEPKALFPLCFCRECGQEYYTVSRVKDEDGKATRFVQREFHEQRADSGSEIGYLYISEGNPFPHDAAAALKRLPPDWLEPHRNGWRVRSIRRKYLPEHVSLDAWGGQADAGQTAVFLPARFMFCFYCGVSYPPRLRSEFSKLATLSAEGRSSATTILSLEAIRALKDSPLAAEAQKLLSFTDNRQDASLQAGHFNDFIEVCLLRGAIHKAVAGAGSGGLRYDEIASAVFKALDLPYDEYASNPQAGFAGKRETERALRDVLGYRVYRDLRRGWRVTLPNLEQCGLLRVDYVDLAEVCAAESIWAGFHPALAAASPSTRENIARVLLDLLRRELAIKVRYLDSAFHEKLVTRNHQHLKTPWALDEDEEDKLEPAHIALARSQRKKERGANFLFVSARGSFGQYLRRRSIVPEYGGELDTEATRQLIRQLLSALQIAGIVEEVMPARGAEDVPGYQLNAGALRWRAGDGQAFHDPLRMPNAPSAGRRVNPFFHAFYQQAADLRGFLAAEHTAQVANEMREEREAHFRSGALPILYCSPTMELGVDIAQLNVVNMRNVPPTPANYAQRSGRAGRSGQPALVFTYCASRSPHDQFYFKRPAQMVSGAVMPPRIDLTNRDLLRAHIHAIWLAETGLELGKSLTDVLDMSGDPPSLALQAHVREQINSATKRQQARQRAADILSTIIKDLDDVDALLDSTLPQVALAFDRACDRWRGLYLSAREQLQRQQKIQLDHSRSPADKKQAERRIREAMAQINLLTDISNLVQSDFYSYRYFATEGFLPGYSFPRLPLSAYIPGRRHKQADNYLSRPRFLAISEFGPRAFIYHEGSRYTIDEVMLPVTEGEDSLLTGMKRCAACGYMHPLSTKAEYDLCQRCKAPLPAAMSSLLRMQNVKTRRRDRISADEEERMRSGFELITGLRFRQNGEQAAARSAQVTLNGSEIAQLIYAPTATLWRVNLGWRRRQNKGQRGFLLDMERGRWQRRDSDAADAQDPRARLMQRVIPFVQDNRNCLLLQPKFAASPEQLVSLQAALKRAIESEYQLEDNELAAEALPDSDEPKLLLFYEAAEGGAGVLKHLAEDAAALAQVARAALDICHFDADGSDRGKADNASEDCEAACYDCLLSYGNQRDHDRLDRKSIREALLQLAAADVKPSPAPGSREEHLETMLSQCGSDYEKQWLRLVAERGYRLPDAAQKRVSECETIPDFIYNSDGQYAVIYVDGYHHLFPERQARDREQTECLRDLGYTVLRFGLLNDWDRLFQEHSYLFGGEQ